MALRGHPMGIASRAAFTLLPAAALALLLWALGTFELPQVWRTPWVPSLGIDLAFRLDGLSALMLLLITGVGTGVFIYAGGYLAGHPHQRRLYGALTAFMLAMIGCVTADDLFVLFLLVLVKIVHFFALALVGVVVNVVLVLVVLLIGHRDWRIETGPHGAYFVQRGASTDHASRRHAVSVVKSTTTNASRCRRARSAN